METIKLLINVSENLVTTKTENMVAGNVGDNEVTEIIVTVPTTGVWAGLHLGIHFKSPKGERPDEMNLGVDNNIKIPGTVLDAAGDLKFSIVGRNLAGTEVIHTNDRSMKVLAALSDYGHTTPVAYDTVVSSAISARDTALAAASTADAARVGAEEAEVIRVQVASADHSTAQTDHATTQLQVDAVVANATVDSEVILARGGQATLNARLDIINNNIGQPVGAWKDGCYMKYNDGLEVVSATFSYIILAVTGSTGMKIRGFTSAADLSGIAFFDEKGIYISGEKNPVVATYSYNYNLIVPVNAATVEISCRTAYKSSFVCIIDGITNMLQSVSAKATLLMVYNAFSWHAPSEYTCHVGKQSRIYFEQISTSNIKCFFEVTASGATYPEITLCNEYVEFNFTSAKSATITIKCKTFDNILISSVQIPIFSVVIGTYPSKKYIFIGDSLTDAGTMQGYVKDTIGAGCTLYGTRGIGAYLHEGRSGWSVNDYITLASKSGVANPFFNTATSKFDFAYYATNNPSFADVDHINILLGQNDGYYTARIAQIKTDIIDSILAYNPLIKITVMCLYNLASDGAGTGQYLQSRNQYSALAKTWNDVIYSTLSAVSGITIIPQHCNLDSWWDWDRIDQAVSYLSAETKQVSTNNVHPAITGYKKWGDVFLAYVSKIHA